MNNLITDVPIPPRRNINYHAARSVADRLNFWAYRTCLNGIVFI